MSHNTFPTRPLQKRVPVTFGRAIHAAFLAVLGVVKYSPAVNRRPRKSTSRAGTVGAHASHPPGTLQFTDTPPSKRQVRRNRHRALLAV